MTDSDRPKFAEIMALLSETFNESLSDLRVEGYFIALGDLSVQDVKEAALQAMRAVKFFPRPAELREIIIGHTETQALVAWGELQRQIRREGHTGKPQLSETTQRVVKQLWGSWRNLCETLPAFGVELLAWEKRFTAAFGAEVRADARRRLDAMKRKELGE